MIDGTTKKPKPLRVLTANNAPAYIMLPVQQLDDVRELLDANNVPYWVDEFAISIDGEPEVIVINLGMKVDPSAVQAILDNAF